MRDDLVAAVFKNGTPPAALEPIPTPAPGLESPPEDIPPPAEPEPPAEEAVPAAPTGDAPQAEQPEEKPTSESQPAVDRAELLQRIRSRQNNGSRSGSRTPR
jgi:hypothetical protein